MRVALLALILLLGCGAKTALEEGPPREVDAGPRRDAGFNFSTLPCRWSVGVPVIVHQADPEATPVYSGMGGATVGDRDSVINRAAVYAVNGQGDDETVGGLVTTFGIAERLGAFTRPAPFAIFSGRRAFMSQEPPGCDFVVYDFDFVEFSRVSVPLDSCQVSQTRLDALEIATRGPPGSGATVSSTRDLEEGGEVSLERLFVTATPDPMSVRVYHQPGRASFALVVSAAGVAIERHVGDEVTVAELGFTPTRVVAAPDRLNGGLLFVAERPQRLVRYPVEGPLEPEVVVDLSGLVLAGAIASNETEALFPLADGRLAYVPLANAFPRFVDLEDVPSVTSMEVVLRPDDSAGGLLYETNEAGLPTLWWRPLTCNR